MNQSNVPGKPETFHDAGGYPEARTASEQAQYDADAKARFDGFVYDCVPGTEIEKPTVILDDGNAFSIIGKVVKALKRAGCPVEIVKAFSAKAKSGDYDTVLQTAMEYAEVDDQPNF